MSATLQDVCRPLASTTYETLKSLVADYLVVRNASVLRKHVRDTLGDTRIRDTIVDQLNVLQYKRSAKRIWKAVWSTLHNLGTQEAAALYDVAVEDVDLVLSYMSEDALNVLLSTPSEDVKPNIDDREVAHMTTAVKKHARRMGKRLCFIAMYDPAVDQEDLHQDLLVKALKTMYDYENMQPWGGATYEEALLNKVRSGVSSGAADILKYHADPKRTRVVGLYTCDACACTSTTPTRHCQWCGASMERATRTPHMTTSARMFTDGLQTPNGSESGRYVDLAGDLWQQLDKPSRDYLCCLLRESPTFDAWLQENHEAISDEVADGKIRMLAARYVGRPQRQLDRGLKKAALKARTR